MRERGVPLLHVPGNYYDDLAARLELEPALLEELRELDVLYDRDAPTASSCTSTRPASAGACSSRCSSGAAATAATAPRIHPSGWPRSAHSQPSARRREMQTSWQSLRPPARTLRPRTGGEERELPEAPPLRRLIGPSVILVGVGVASGEYILFPYIASQAGLVFLWAAIVGVAVQFFINMEIERYTLATGETAIGSFQRLWRPWGAILAVGAVLATMWPGWATSAATVAHVRDRRRRPERDRDRRPARDRRDPDRLAGRLPDRREAASSSRSRAVLVFIVIALFAAIKATAFEDTSNVVTSFGTFPSEIGLAILVGALAAAGAGGANNLVQSNWIRDKGFGMGSYVPRIVSPITGHEEAAPGAERLALPDRRGEPEPLEARGGSARTSSSSCPSRASRRSRSSSSRWLAYSTVYKNPDLPGLERLRLHLARGERARRRRRRLVRDDVPRRRRDQPVRRRARDRRLRLAAGGRRDPHRLHARQQALEREQAVLRGRVVDDHLRLPDPARRLRPAARAADDLDRHGRRDHDRLHEPAADHQPPLPARTRSSSAATGA